MITIRKFIIAILIGFTTPITYGAVTPLSSSGSERFEVDEINILGVTAFKVGDLVKVVEVNVGEPQDKLKIGLTVKNILELYRSGGYEQVKVEPHFSQKVTKVGAKIERILEFVVTEGRPTRIAEVIVDYDLAGWAEQLTSVSLKIGISPGDLYDRERLLNGYRALQDSLTTWDFLSPKIEESRVEVVSPPPGPAFSAQIPTTEKWVRVRIKVILGDRVSFAYRDNTVFPNSQLSSWIEEQRLLGFSQDYIQRIQSRFEDEYRKLGFDLAKVEVFTFEDQKNQRRRVTYVFHEGPRVEIEHIDFDGNILFSPSVLRDRFYERASPSISRNYYVAKDVEQSAEVLVEWLKSQGYLSAKLISISRIYRPNGSRVDLTVYLYEGEQTITDEIRFNGLTVFTPSELMGYLGNQPGKPLNLYALNEGLEKLKAHYREKGYLDIQITNESTPRLVLYSHENRVAEMSIDLKEGVQYRVSRIDIEGIQKTKASAIFRELEVHEGEILSERDWYRSEAKLRRLGIFSTVSIKALSDPNRKDGKILKILVEEGTPGLVAGGVGLRNDLGGRAFGQIQYANLWGKNHTVAFTATANRRFKNFGAEGYCASTKQFSEDPMHDHCFIEGEGTIGYVWPWFGLGDTTFRPRASVERTQFRNFDADTVALQMSWERPLQRSWGLTGIFSYSLEIVNQYNANVSTDNQHLRIGSLSPTLILDRRDNPLAPTRGTYTTLQYDLAQPAFGSQNNPADGNPPISYWRMQFRNDVYIPLPRAIDLYLSARMGLEYNQAAPPPGADPTTLGSGYAIPLIKQFTLGGVGSLRGFGEQSLYIDPNYAVRGSITYVNYRAQVDLPFAGSMKFGPFIDAAQINLDRFCNGHLRTGIGAGFHYKSPVGPVNFDIGVNPSPQAKEDSYKVHFSIGNI